MSDQLSNGLKQIMLAGIGAMAITAEKSKELVEELVKKGELTVEQGKVVNEELKRSKNENRERAEKTEKAAPQDRQADVFGQVERMSKEEREKLKEKLRQLDEEK